MKRKLLFMLLLFFSSFLFAQKTTTTCYPDNADKNTGSTDGVTFTQTSLIRTESFDAERGWARFNTSAIPDGDNINSVELHIYVSEDNYAYFKVMEIEADPLLGNASTVFDDCGDGTSYASYGSNFPDPGWYVVDLGEDAVSKLKGLLGDDWFAVGLYEYEDYEDYYLEFDGWDETNKPYIVVDHNVPPICPEPSGQDATNVTSATADLVWTENGSATTWNIEYGPEGFTQGTGTTISVTTNPYTLTGLSASTAYDWYIQADCGGGDQSNWVGPDNFTTLLEPFTNPTNCGLALSIPDNGCVNNNYLELPVQVTGAPGTQLGTDVLLSSISIIIDHPYDSDLDIFLVSPSGVEVELSSDNGGSGEDYGDPDNCPDDVTTFDMDAANSITSGTAPFIGNYIPEGDFADFNDGSNPNGVWKLKVCDDASTDAGTVEYVKIVLIAPPSCSDPSGQDATNVTSTTADLEWTENGSATTWNIEYGPPGFTLGSGISIIVTSNPYTLTGLMANTGYDWYIQADCGGGDQSNWVGPDNFKTACLNTTVPYFQNFDNVITPSFPSCMTVENTNGDNVQWETSTLSHSEPNSAYIGYNTLEDMQDWFFTQGLNLTAGVTYEVDFVYKAKSSNYPEKLAVYWGTAPESGSMLATPIFDNNNITNNDWLVGAGSFTPTTTGTYYVGFYGYSDANMYNLYVDDIQIVEQTGTSTWNGNVDNYWKNSNNWVNGVPSYSDDVVIPSGMSNYPTIDKIFYCNNITVESDIGGDGSIIGEENIMVGGVITVERYITAGKWHDISPSAIGQTLNAFYFNSNPSVWLTKYNEPDNSRTYLMDLATELPSGSGYEVWVDNSKGDVTIEFEGDFQSYDLILTTVSTPAISYSGPDPLGFNLIGNPFASAIDLDEGTWNMTDVSNSFWVWNPDAGAYYDWNSATGAGSLTDGIVPMGQGFFIQTTDASPSITIPVDARVHSTQDYYKGSNNDLELISLKAESENSYDEVNIVFLEGAQEGFELFDTRKMFALNGASDQIYAHIEGEDLSLNTLPSLMEEDERIVDIYFLTGSDGVKTIVANIENLDGTDVILEDMLLNKFQNLNENPTYVFDAYLINNPDRFRLHINRSVTTVGEKSANKNIMVYSYDKNVYVISKGEMINSVKNVIIYDIIGRNIVSQDIPAGEIVKIPVQLDNSYLIVKVTAKSNVSTYKIFIK
jgi:subtilisin-like proprotein convertase family protein